MIKAPTGESQKVTGRIIAMVVSGPIPGRTPIAVPITQPKKHSAMFCQVSATPKPITMLDRMSSMSERRPKRDLYFQRENEPERPQQERERKARQGDEDERPPPTALRHLAGAHERYQRERRADRDQCAANQTRKIAGAHGGGGPDLQAAS